ncbi:hypothetical protein GCM10022403_006540 [Streptomyces coacervatus]|uniref:Uncharacterized protein n=1 Tax=Streptomyces coacervatus TaxID=647381 RepID=A0ABP7GTY4_9ACTN|nr:hypothetical protein [Streptomyces coacervatus]MDF2273125.1 hypothetical protein [Streptomyces coacervatus]
MTECLTKAKDSLPFAAFVTNRSMVTLATAAAPATTTPGSLPARLPYDGDPARRNRHRPGDRLSGEEFECARGWRELGLVGTGTTDASVFGRKPCELGCGPSARNISNPRAPKRIFSMRLLCGSMPCRFA